MVDEVVQQNVEEVHLVLAVPLKGHVLINPLHSLPMVMLLNHLAKVMEAQIMLMVVNNHSSSNR